MNTQGLYLASVLALFGLAFSQGTAKAAGTVPNQFQGAWLAESIQCSTVYRSSSKGTTFKQPADAFAQALIISANIVKTPTATCRVREASQSGERITLQLTCSNAISPAPVTAMFSLADEGRLVRLTAEGQRTGSAYARCNR